MPEDKPNKWEKFKYKQPSFSTRKDNLQANSPGAGKPSDLTGSAGVATNPDNEPNSSLETPDTVSDNPDLLELMKISRTLDILSTETHEIAETRKPDNKKDIYRALKEPVVSQFASLYNQSPLISDASDEKKQENMKIVSDMAIRTAGLKGIPLSKDALSIISEWLYNDIFCWGPLQELLDNNSISEIMVVGPKKVFIESSGRLVLTDTEFIDDAHLMNIINRIAGGIGRRIDISSPHVDARLPDGSRVHAIIPPLSPDGPALTIRKFSSKKMNMENLINYGSITSDMAYFLGACIKARINIIISGGTGSGKTTLLNIMSGLINKRERVITIEDALELKVNETHPHVVRLETRPPNIEGAGEVTVRDLLKDALRMRPDRIIVGECRGGEAFDMLQAMNTGHEGSMTSIHSNSPKDAISRLESMILMAGFDMPLTAVKSYIGGAVDMIVQQSRFPDGTRKVTRITEVSLNDTGDILLNDIFAYKQTGYIDGMIAGHYDATGHIPSFTEKFAVYDLEFPYEVLKSSNRQTF